MKTKAPMEKIDSLTPAQERALAEYRNEWLNIGRSTEPADRPTAEKAITEMYRLLSKPTPRFWWCDGPAVGSMLRTLFRSEIFLRANLRDNLRDNLGDNLGANLGANLRDNLRDNLRANLRANLRDNLRANLWANLGANLWANLGDNLGANLGANLWANLGANLRDNLDWNFWGQHESSWPAFYEWPDSVLRLMYSKEQRGKLKLWLDLSKSTGWWQPFEGIVFMCERPSVQSVDERGFLHKDGAPAFLCRDGWPLYLLHGARMKPEHVLTSAEKISPETVLAETNVDVRRELIRKVGVERMLAKLPHKVLEKRDNYEVLSVHLSEQIKDARYLKMINPSIGCFHIEGVEPSISTVEAALNWRNKNWHTDAEVLT